jgi:hypothetical protein
MRLAVCLSAALVSTAYGIKDGNPYLWDRVRRCDDDYGVDPDPRNPYDTEPCGLCEGIGGEVWGDELDAFQTAKCSPVLSAADGAEPIAPAYWEGSFTCDLEEIMINECDENGQNCNFPGPTSVMEHEYVRQAGLWNMDFTNGKRLVFEYDYVQDATVPPMANPGRTSPTDIFHYAERPMPDVPKDMFINVIGAIGPLDLCICVDPGIGPITNDHMLPNPEDITSINSTYPVIYIGQEQMAVEYYAPGETAMDMLVDHWMKGPHHIWVDRTDPSTRSYGQIVRGWQPWNALQIFKNYRDLRPEAVAKLDAGPAAISACNNPPFPGITCDKEESADRVADPTYVARAEEKKPRTQFMGESFEDMADKLNIHLETLLADTVGHTECSDFNIEELNDVMRMVNSARDTKLNSIYQNNMDPRRVAHGGHMDLEKRFARETELVEAAPELEHMVRDGKCHEVVMWFIHHLSADSQREIAEMVSLPMLPRVRHYMELGASSAHKEINSAYQDEISCADCHLESGV